MEEEAHLSLPCLICGDDVPVPSPIENDIVAVTNATIKLKDDPVFQCFLKLFKVADFDGNDDEADKTFKFCGSCKLHLGNLLDLQIKVDQLMKQIKSGVEQLKGKLESSEETFESGDIYDSYPKYRAVRSKIVNDSHDTSTNVKSKRKNAVTVTSQQKLALTTILTHGHELNWTPSTSNPEPEPAQPRLYLKLYEYPEKQLVLCGDYTFNLLDTEGEGKGQVKCTPCDLIIPYNKGMIRNHVIKVHMNIFACPHCSTNFSSGGNLQLHIQTVHEGRQSQKKRNIIECKICKKPISTQQRKGHEWSHKSKREKEEALRDPKLAAELPRSFRNEKIFQCDLCKDRWFSGLFLLKRHQNRAHRAPEERMELCPECGGSYLNLKTHLRTQHAKEEDGVVDLMKTCLEPGCGKRFLNLGQLTRHKNQVHKKLKPFECAHCGKRFGGKWNYQQHLKSHEVKVKLVKPEVGE